MRLPRFPIMGSKTIKSIPWESILPHEKQAKANHDQSLETLASRGGLGCDEAVWIMTGTRWKIGQQLDNAEDRLRELTEVFP